MTSIDAHTRSPLLIGGQWVQGTGDPLLSVNPATGEVNAEVGTASDRDVDAAVAEAHRALEGTGWRDLLPHARAAQLNRIAEKLVERAEELGKLAMQENGKTLRESVTQTRAAAATFRYYAGLCETLESQVTPSRGEYLSLTVYEPFGVVAAIVPWNSPVTLAADKLAPALAAGNAVILKPSELTSLVSLELGRACMDAGLPPGLVSVVPGTSAASGSLVRHPGVQMISFTGGASAGRAVAHAAAEKLTPTVLELGGKSPNVILEDADLDAAAMGVVAGIFGSLGQSCIAGSRLFVQESVHGRLLDRILAITNAIRLGSPADEATQLGPLASFEHRDRVHGMIRAAVGEGANVITGGSPPEGTEFRKGAYYRPTVLDGVDNRSSISRSEVFGPVLCVLPFSNVDDLVKQANDTPYGLACGIWTGDFRKAWTIARQIQAGTIWINTYRQNSVSTPFGGFKESGWGRERGPHGLRQYQQLKSVFVGLADKPLSLDR